MKNNVAILTLVGLFSVSAFAAPVGQTFTGMGIGIDLDTAKYTSHGQNGKRKASPMIVLDYGMDYGNNLVGIVQAKAKLNRTKIANDLTQKNKYTVAYQQGYRVGSDLLSYVKIDASQTKIGDTNYRGYGYGAGVKYAVSSNIEVGGEYTHSHIKRNGNKLKGNELIAHVGYRF
ncbi:hypothetical protein A6046_03930 [[Haemophilus] ducreyi]|uniref:Outer membrane protein beta-barrel domain-containing protein n=2 Tax=Haemophilus ducreyi TaxID=730 RepID=Q7VP29_HAEDU|nr:porin family protein [[Haemophilus] ducreyi]AAP95258.1 hypothetical protein HD_0279 [[Haemophilus] ducreyi 35000HP]AKO30401.1 membrane protein [[Haemophilus] ducreyi]AKO31835.1 membrane protein [[Haemophilus] ducreyi]AKO33287.1 membrane protein [[Haemophilus] ducreyi]AKO34737.1 membrane protein [[Haemophilus] ducreyi]